MVPAGTMDKGPTIAWETLCEGCRDHNRREIMLCRRHHVEMTWMRLLIFSRPGFSGVGGSLRWDQLGNNTPIHASSACVTVIRGPPLL